MKRFMLQGVKDDEQDGKDTVSKSAALANANDAASGPSKTAMKSTASLPGDPTSATIGPPVASESDENDTRSAGPSTQTHTDTKSQPVTPLSVEQRRQITIDNLTAIGKAMELYLKDNNTYPPPYLTEPGSDAPLLSWRVALLPYLGYEPLYKQFRRNEPWNSAHNQQLLPRIPSVYQSPDRFDRRTNYLVPVATSTAFWGARGKPIRQFEDGAHHTVLVAEADDALAVDWTEPSDLTFDALNPHVGLGGLRQDGFFVMWGGGSVGRVPSSLDERQLKAIFTIDAGDRFVMSQVNLPATARTAAAQIAAPSGTSPLASAPATVADSTAPSVPLPSPAVAPMLMESQSAFNEGREADAMHLYYAAALSGGLGQKWQGQFRWVPGLRRPAAVIRYGIGIEYGGPRSGYARRVAVDPRQRENPEAVYQKLTGQFGTRILDELAATPFYAPFRTELPTDDRTRSRNRNRVEGSSENLDAPRLAPGIRFLGVESQRVLMRLAQKEEIDVLVLLTIDERLTRNKIWNRDGQLILFDVLRQKEIYRTARLNNRKVEATLSGLLEDDPVADLTDKLSDYLSEKLIAVEIPVKLESTHATRRVEDLSNRSYQNPLRALAEIRLYYQLGLIDIEQLLAAYRRQLDEKSALTLIGGSADDKRAVLRSWFPGE